MSVVRQADDSFVCFGAKPDKVFWTRDLEVTGSDKGTREESWTRELEEKAVGEGWREWAIDTGEQRDQSDEMRSRAVRQDESQWVGIPVAL